MQTVESHSRLHVGMSPSQSHSQAFNEYPGHPMNDQHTEQPMPILRGRKLLVGGVLLFIVGGIMVVKWFRQPSIEQILSEAQKELTKGNFQESYHLAKQILKESPQSVEAILIKGQSALQLGYCTEAEHDMRKVLETENNNLTAHKELVRILKVEGRYWELLPHALALFQLGDSGNEFLIPLAAPDTLQISDQEWQIAAHCGNTVPEDSLPLLGMARRFAKENNIKDAKQILYRITAKTPQQIEPQIQLGALFYEADDKAGFLKWHQQLPASSEQHPDLWFLRGMFALEEQEPMVALRCFWEALLRNPNHRRANFQLAQQLKLAGKPQQATPFAKRFARLEEVSRLVTKGDDFSKADISAETMSRIAQSMEQMGRLREAVAWYQNAMKRGPLANDAQLKFEAIKDRLGADTPLTIDAYQPAKQVNLSGYPLPAWQPFDEKSSPPTVNKTGSNVVFKDVAAETGLKFQYQNGANSTTGLARMFEFSGGGVAILDYDGDLWPDIYLTQGCTWPPGAGQGAYKDRLYRNINGERFEDVTSQAGLGDEAYSQGATVGDFNNDGFPDLLLANIGENRLYQNNGDGTFEDVTATCGIQGAEWTTSCLIADLNQDSLPDLYCVNYLGGSDLFNRRCERNGLPVQCPLHLFPSAQDRVYLNQGDGSFQDVTKTWGLVLPNGKGLGIVAADFQEDGQLRLFIANDDTPNFYLVPHHDHKTNRFSYQNQGVISGLAFDDLGSAQSCMGVAAGDANNDGLLDLHVTNFTNEHNNLYLQIPHVGFADKSRETGLHWASMPLMGWGTQFLDGELDGSLDLIVANGHLDENTSGKLPYKMRAQYFRNDKNQFSEVSSHQLGSYFTQLHAGRAVARLDWNRDGLDDACITHVDAPASLLSNQTSKIGNSLVIHLRGVRGSRDAIGSIVRVQSEGTTLVRHLTAGDGYQASNERKLIFGLGEQVKIDLITIKWPSGAVQQLTAQTANREILIIEGQNPLELGSFAKETTTPLMQ